MAGGWGWGDTHLIVQYIAGSVRGLHGVQLGLSRGGGPFAWGVTGSVTECISIGVCQAGTDGEGQAFQ